MNSHWASFSWIALDTNTTWWISGPQLAPALVDTTPKTYRPPEWDLVLFYPLQPFPEWVIISRLLSSIRRDLAVLDQSFAFNEQISPCGYKANIELILTLVFGSSLKALSPVDMKSVRASWVCKEKHVLVSSNLWWLEMLFSLYQWWWQSVSSRCRCRWRSTVKGWNSIENGVGVHSRVSCRWEWR